MNIWGKNERSWRRKNRRAVSPIIATILLVAITVVLAAVLYILIQQYTKNGSNGSPLGSALALGTSSDAAAGGTNYYNITVESASSTLTLSNVIFQLKSPSGAITAVAGLTVSLVNPKGAV
ncbi:MAG TPA: archaellin/type IV pilin N-terminal domain-containing protein, partial [Thermoplasmata archaeon]|nr:archaellin/type IV pilin N-terminal domain-containing protein [Thermoplasmata archaeon]